MEGNGGARHLNPVAPYPSSGAKVDAKMTFLTRQGRERGRAGGWRQTSRQRANGTVPPFDCPSAPTVYDVPTYDQRAGGDVRCAMCNIQDHDLLVRVVSWRVHWPRGEDGGTAWVATDFPGREISSVLRGSRAAGRNDRLTEWFWLDGDGWMDGRCLLIRPVGVAQKANGRRRGNVPRTPFVSPLQSSKQFSVVFLDRLLFVPNLGTPVPRLSSYADADDRHRGP